MTGGLNRNRLSSVEVYHPGTNTSCTLPSLPKKNSHHSQDGLVLCGGYGSESGRSCNTLNTDTAQWTKTHSLSERRDVHSSWRREDGSILIIGGDYSDTSTELVSDSSGVSTPGFTLKYETRWVVLCLYNHLSLYKAWLEVKSSYYNRLTPDNQLILTWLYWLSLQVCLQYHRQLQRCHHWRRGIDKSNLPSDKIRWDWLGGGLTFTPHR